MTLAKSPQNNQADFGQRPILFAAIPGFQHIGVISVAGIFGGVAVVATCGGVLPAMPFLIGMAIGTANDLAWKCKQESDDDYDSDYDNEVEVKSEEIADETLTVERVNYNDQSEFTEPNPWGQLEEIKPKVYSDPMRDPISDLATATVAQWEVEREFECIAAGITIEEYRRVVETWPLDMPSPSPAQIAIVLGRQPAQPDSHTAAATAGGVGGLAVAEPVATPVEGQFEEAVATDGLEPGFVDIDAINELKEQIATTYKKGCDLSDISHIARGSAYYLLKSCYELDPHETVFSQNWLINNAFKISKGSKAHGYFRNVRSRVRGEMGLV